MDKLTVRFNADLRVVAVTYTGRLTLPEVREMVTRALQLAREKRADILYDLRGADIEMSVGDMYFLPRTLPIKQQLESADGRSAAIMSPRHDEDKWRFFELTAQNAGTRWRGFLSEDEALAWLAQERLSSQSQ